MGEPRRTRLMKDAELVLLERRGCLIRKSLSIVRDLAASPLADEDTENESEVVTNLKGLIVNARAVVDEDSGFVDASD